MDVTRGEGAGEFSCPGSVLRTIPEEHRLTAGLAPSLAVFFSRSPAWREMTGDEREAARIEEPEDGKLTTLLRYAPTRVLLSGWIRAPEAIEGHLAWVRAGYGEGAVHLFGQATATLFIDATLGGES